MLAAAVGSTAAGGVAVEQLFGTDWFSTLISEPEKLGAQSGVVLLLPIVFLLMRGVQSYLFSVALLAGTMTGLLMYAGVEAPIEQLLTVTGVGSAVAVLCYRIIT